MGVVFECSGDAADRQKPDPTKAVFEGSERLFSRQTQRKDKRVGG
jgi:hypothetical protein